MKKTNFLIDMRGCNYYNLTRYTHGRIAQLVERLVYTQMVGGSSPSSPTTPFPINPLRSLGAAVAHFVHTEGVAGSNPVATTIAVSTFS